MSNQSTTLLACGHEVLDADQCHYCTYIQNDLIEELAIPKDSRGQARDFSHHDEFQFILVHQSCELSFKGYLYESKRVISCLEQDQLSEAIAFVERCRSWILIAARQLQHLVEHLTPEDFAFFRDFLSPASGAESIRFRLIELITGLGPQSPYVSHRGHIFSFREFLDRAPAEGRGRPKTRWWTEQMTQCAHEQTVRKSFLAYLNRNSISSLKSLEVNEYNIQCCCELLTSNNTVSQFAHALVKIEKAILAVRKVHLNAARKHISESPGTGHTDGVMYLKSVLDTARCFPALTKAYEKLEREGRLS